MACRLLTLASSFAPLPWIAFWYIRSELEDPEYALKAKLESIPAANVSRLKGLAVTCVDKWCRNLLEIRDHTTKHGANGFQSEIVFLHRTVMDFLSDPEVSTFLQSHVEKNYDEWISLGRLKLAQVKTLANGPLCGKEDER